MVIISGDAEIISLDVFNKICDSKGVVVAIAFAKVRNSSPMWNVPIIIILSDHI